MNETASAPGASLLPDSTGLITSMHLVAIALFALLALAIIVVGMRKKRNRKEAEHAFDERVAEAEDAIPTTPPAPTPTPTPEPRVAVPGPIPTPPLDAPLAPAPLADEPIAAAAPLDASPAAEANAAPASGHDPADAPLTQLKGLGPKVAQLLADRGITRVGQLAALSDAEAVRLDAELGPFTGRLTRDRWIEQARLLAAGDRAGFEAAFGRL